MTCWARLTIAGICTAGLSLAQDVTGTWTGDAARSSQGTLTRGRAPQWVINFSKDRHGELKGSISDGAQGHHLITTFVSISLIGSKLTFTYTSPNGPISFVGNLSDDGNSIEGWLLDQHMTLKREGHAQAKRPVERPDAPQSPPVAAALSATAAEWSETLSRALAKLAGTSQRLLKYSCIETIERAYYTEPAVKKLGPHALSEASVESCDGKEFSKDGHLNLETEDRLRLAVAVASNRQIQSWAAANRFDSRPLNEIVPEGPMTTAASGTMLVDVFENPGAKYRFIGRRNEGSRVVFEYEFEVPLAFSSSEVRAGTGWEKTAYHGTFQIDAASAELVRLASETDPLPLETKMCRFRTDTDYRYLQIGDGRFLMPGRSEFNTLGQDAHETRSVTTFSACHEYVAESTVVFNQEAPDVDAKVTPKAAAPLPPGLSLTVALLEPIDMRTAAAGDAVAGKVTKAVRAPGSSQVLVDAGAILHGRITQMQHRYSTSQFAFAILYETLEQRDAVSPVAMELDRELKAEEHTRNGLARRGSEFSLHAPSAPGDAGSWFAVPAVSGGYVVAAGFESKWVTVVK
jgi:hypothetical protein